MANATMTLETALGGLQRVLKKHADAFLTQQNDIKKMHASASAKHASVAT